MSLGTVFVVHKSSVRSSAALTVSVGIMTSLDDAIQVSRAKIATLSCAIGDLKLEVAHHESLLVAEQNNLGALYTQRNECKRVGLGQGAPAPVDVPQQPKRKILVPSGLPLRLGSGPGPVSDVPVAPMPRAGQARVPTPRPKRLPRVLPPKLLKDDTKVDIPFGTRCQRKGCVRRHHKTGKGLIPHIAEIHCRLGPRQDVGGWGPYVRQEIRVG